jgi:hypothetical protein
MILIRQNLEPRQERPFRSARSENILNRHPIAIQSGDKRRSVEWPSDFEPPLSIKKEGCK